MKNILEEVAKKFVESHNKRFVDIGIKLVVKIRELKNGNYDVKIRLKGLYTADTFVQVSFSLSLTELKELQFPEKYINARLVGELKDLLKLIIVTHN